MLCLIKLYTNASKAAYRGLQCPLKAYHKFRHK
nr:MAG TPA: hypothetical protein [Caudoviricetes sp.]